MLASLLFVGALLQSSAAQDITPKVSQAQETSILKGASTANAEADTATLINVKRVFVESFGDDAISKEIQSMIVSSLVETKHFKVTEKRERADAILKGTALEKTSQEVHAYGESTAVGGASGGYSSTTQTSTGGFVARHMGTSDSSVNTETINEARVAIRLVNPEGDVIWTSIQESKGAKYKGASADVAEKCIKQLLRDIDKLSSKNRGQSSAPATDDAQNH